MTVTGWIIESMHLDRDLEDVLALEALCFTNPTTRDMLKWEAERSDVTRAYVLRPLREESAPVHALPVEAEPSPPSQAPSPQAPPAPAILAYCSVWLIFEELHINTLAVHPDWRRNGLASTLLRHVLADAVQQGADKATLEVRRSNEAARQLYERFGFETTAVRTNYYRDPVEDALILWRHHLASAIESARPEP
jgi:ribosomal-protein-alanine N-acetyltransferase